MAPESKIPGVRELWKGTLRACSMAAAPLAPLFTGHDLDEIVCGYCEAPQQVFSIDAPHI